MSEQIKFGDRLFLRGEKVLFDNGSNDAIIESRNGTLVIRGNLTVEGTTTTVNTEETTFADPYITLNGDWTGPAVQDVGIEINRGDDPLVRLTWDETNDQWSFEDKDIVTTGNITANFVYATISGNVVSENGVVFFDSTGDGIIDARGGNIDNTVIGATTSAAGYFTTISGDGTDITNVLTNYTTDDLAEGPTNLYYTDERVDDRVAELFEEGYGLTSNYDDALGTYLVEFDAQNIGNGEQVLDTSNISVATFRTIAAGNVINGGNDDLIVSVINDEIVIDTVQKINQVAFNTYTGNGTLAQYTLPYTVTEDWHLLVTIDGVVQEPTVSYTVAGNIITLSEILPSNVVMNVIRLGTSSQVSYINDATTFVGETPSYYLDYNNHTNTPDLSSFATISYVDSETSAIIDSAPVTLDTLNKIATSINNDPAFHTTITNALALKANSADLATVATTGSYNDLLNKPTNRMVTDDDNVVAGHIIPLTDNTYDLGTSARQWKVVYGHTIEATYADLAERYEADAIYEVGTVVALGGTKEITASDIRADTAVVGIISTDPALKMNSAAGPDETHPYVALKGRVPCKVVGPIRKGQLLVNSGEYPGYAIATTTPSIGSVIGKAMEDFEPHEKGVIEVFVSLM